MLTSFYNNKLRWAMLDHADTLIKGWTMCREKKEKDHTSCQFEEYPDNDRSPKMFHYLNF